MKQLVIDVGMFEGSDTEQYLTQGYDVVAIEANPANVETAIQRFKTDIRAGRLRIIHCAVADRSGLIDLQVPDDSPGWATLSKGHIERSQAARTKAYRSISVPARTFESILEKVGVPYYLKIDIEGSDMLCVEALRRFDGRPAFLSVESRVGFKGLSAVLAELRTLESLGYRRFAYVDQRWNPPLTSGPFGDSIKARWLSARAARRLAVRLHYANRLREHLHRPLLSWYDLHARMN